MYRKYMATGVDRRLISSKKIGKAFSVGHESNVEKYSKNNLTTPEVVKNNTDCKSESINNDCYSYDPRSDDILETSDRVIPLITHRRNKSGSRSLKGSLSLNSSSLETGDFVEELGRYVSEMARNDGGPEDVWAQLQQKEADLLLAAELGKALLEKNEELMKQHERLTEQYSSKLEALEQEKHLLRRRLQATEEESEARMLELQSDVRELSSKLDQKDTNVKQSEREKTSLISELTAQNNRLTNQLKEASAQEIQLTAQLQGLKDQCSMRKTSLQDHVSSLETLKEELQLTSDKKMELERRLQTALGDRDSLQQQLEEASDRVAMLERHIREQELKYQNSFTDMERLQRENTTLAERLGGGTATPIGGMTASGVFGPRRTLLAEMETDAAGDAMGPTNSEVLHVYKQLRALCSHLRSGHDDDSGLHSDLSISSLDGGEQQQLRTGVLAEVAEDLAVLVSGLEGVRFKDMLEKLSQQLHDREADIQGKNDLILELQTKVSVWEVELASAREEAQSARADAAGGELARDAAVCEARAARDAAHTRRTKAETDAARARVELSQTAGQLMEAVRQKIELCQQLDQWQMDMQELIEDQMRSKLSSQERKRKVADPGNSEPTRTSKILGFFQR